MELDLSKFKEVCNPYRTLIPENDEDWEYYIDFTPLIERNIVDELGRAICLSPNSPTCQLLTGYNGCGKSTALLKLKRNLEMQGFHVVYFESSEYLDRTDIVISDILLAIACQIIETLKKVQIELHPDGLIKQFSAIAQLLQIDNFDNSIKISEFYLKITELINNNREYRLRFKQKIEMESHSIKEIINNEILKIAYEELQHKKKKGIVVIVDHLEHLDTTYINVWRPVFLDRAERLRQLNCHMVYTTPLALSFSKDIHIVTRSLGAATLPGFLSMIPVQLPNGQHCKEGIDRLRQIVLARAFPTIIPDKRLGLITKIFDCSQTLDRLCLMSGGHVETLLKLLYNCLGKQDPPLSRNCLEEVIKEYRNQLRRTISQDEWNLLLQIVQDPGKQENVYQKWFQGIPSNFLFGYSHNNDNWFTINPILAEDQEFQSRKSPMNLKKDNQMKDFFISYNSKDKIWADWIAWILYEAGYSVVYAAWDFRPGENFVLKMQEATAETQKTIAVLSDNYINAEYTHPEWAAAFARDPQGRERTLVPIRVEKCELVGILKTIIYVDIVGLTAPDAHSAILGAFSTRGKPTQAPPFPGAIKPEGITPTPVQYPGNSTNESIIDSITVNNSSKKNWTPEERISLMKKLNALSANQFNILVFALAPSSGEVPEMPSSQGDRTFALVIWAERPGGCGLTQVEQVFDSITGS